MDGGGRDRLKLVASLSRWFVCFFFPVFFFWGERKGGRVWYGGLIAFDGSLCRVRSIRGEEIQRGFLSGGESRPNLSAARACR